ncbi:gamma-interferon-inducible protein 16-like [Chionomys nivalis]|uniref:gamma-interferon-inducible protein 16-like n=1 Tax=Chionomys nivalis TaxID=269649 RepID=UPI0025969085|nr:gamma-interferon-inducible protein 16-like [Chionomys nivalis]
MSEHKKIVLKGLECMEDYHFRIIKSLLRRDLHLSERTQNDYDRIQIADLMEDTFPKDAGLGILIEFCQENEDLEYLVEDLKAEKAKVEEQKKGKNKTAVEGKQGEPSSAHGLCFSNAPSSEEKQTAETENGKKRKLNQEQTQPLEPSGSNTQKDEGCLQTFQKPPTPSSNSSNKKQKTTNTKKQSTLKTDDWQEKHQLLGLSATSNSSAAWEGQTLQGLAATASSSLNTPQISPETCDSLKMAQGSPAPSCQSFLISPVSNSSIHLNSPVTLRRSNPVQTPYVPSSTATSNVWVPSVHSETVSSSLSAPQMSPVSGSISAQSLHLPTEAAFNSIQPLHNPQTGSGSDQSPSAPAILKSKDQVIETPPATGSSSVQVPHTLPGAVPRNVSTTQVPQRTTDSRIQTLNPARVNVARNAQVPGPLATVPVYFLTSLPSPATASSSLQVLPLTTSNSLPDPWVPRPIATSRVQTTQMHAAAASSFIQAPHALPLTMPRSVCPTQEHQGVASSTGQALPCPKVEAPRCALALQMPSATTSESLLAPPTTSKSLLTPMVSPATTSSSSCETPRRGNIPKEPAKEEGYHREPKEVMVLKVTEPFTYDLIDDKRMFHATVATENEFFRVKIFDPVLRNEFIPNKIIAISNYFGLNGFLEIHETSCVSDVDNTRTMNISKTLRQRANATPKIRDLFSQAQGTYVNGEFVVYKKTERNPFIYYGIEDDTGKMQVVVYGRLTSIKCEPGQKLRLICFELSSSKDKWQLKSVRHSYMKEKQTAETENGKKRKLNQEQTQPLEPSGSNTQKDEGCLQTFQKPPTPSSNSSNKKTTNNQKQSTLKTDDWQNKHQLLGLSATSNSSAAWEGQTLQGLAATASSRLNTPQTSSGTCDSLKTAQGSPAPPCQSFLVSPVSNSSIHLNSPVTLTQSNPVQTPYVPSSTATSNVWVPSVCSEMVSSSLSAPQMSPVSGSISAQSLHLPTEAASNSIQTLHNPQTGSGSAQSPSAPATLKSKDQFIKTPPATESSSVQVPHTLPGAVPRNVSTTLVPQRTTGSSIQTLNPARENVARNAQVPGPLATVPVYFLTSLPSPATASSSLQVLPLTTSNSLPDPWVPRPIATSRVQTTQMHAAAASSFIQAPHAPPLTMPRSVCPTQENQGVASSTGQALPCPKVEVPRCALAPQIPSATTSESLLAPPTTSKSLLTPMVSPATTSSSSCEKPRRGNIPNEPAKEEGYHREPKEVMVLKVTEPFTYDLVDDKRMFHATVATENEFYRVKIFDPVLKNKFIPNKIIAISNYFGLNGFLEIYKASCVSDVDKSRSMDISKTLRQRANATPKIRDLFSQAQGTYVNGEFVVYKKTERNPFIYYGIKDDTGKMEVVVYGRLTDIKCEPGQKLRVICFELSSSKDKWQLKSVRHSNMQVVNV